MSNTQYTGELKAEAMNNTSNEAARSTNVP